MLVGWLVGCLVKKYFTSILNEVSSSLEWRVSENMLHIKHHLKIC
jgi:hypothetical protein